MGQGRLNTCGALCVKTALLGVREHKGSEEQKRLRTTALYCDNNKLTTLYKSCKWSSLLEPAWIDLPFRWIAKLQLGRSLEHQIRNHLWKLSENKSFLKTLSQWFSTGVPRHIRVPWDSVRGAASYHFTDFWPVLASWGAAKCCCSWTRVPRDKKGWETLL